jgi:hypothetical protein
MPGRISLPGGPLALFLLLSGLAHAFDPTKEVDPGRKWIYLIGRDGCTDPPGAGWAGTNYCNQNDNIMTWTFGGGVRTTWFTSKAPSVTGNPTNLIGKKITFQVRPAAHRRRSSDQPAAPECHWRLWLCQVLAARLPLCQVLHRRRPCSQRRSSAGPPASRAAAAPPAPTLATRGPAPTTA